MLKASFTQNRALAPPVFTHGHMRRLGRDLAQFSKSTQREEGMSLRAGQGPTEHLLPPSLPPSFL